jgi:lactoylglutathione lyase
MVDEDSQAARFLRSIGIVVRDLDRSLGFYIEVMGMKEEHRVDVPDIGLIEAILRFPGPWNPAVVLMHYSDGADHSYVDVGGKLVFQVDDAVSVVEAVRARGGEVTREASEYPGYGLIGMVKDPDGYTLELIQPLG